MAIYDLINPNRYVDREEYEQRIKLCQTCPERLEYSKGKLLTKFSRCPLCGCILSLKAKLDTEKCPIGDW